MSNRPLALFIKTTHQSCWGRSPQMCALVLVLCLQQHGEVFPVGDQGQAHHQQHSHPTNYV